MEQQLELIREQQKETWNKFSGGWHKWNDLTMDWLKPMGDEIIRLLNLKADDVVLDVAAGTGEPGLTIATQVRAGKVIITDLAENMLAIARQNAEEQGIKNIETIACDVCELPFADNTFDKVSCRFGFMFFPDMQLAAQEIVRVLKPGGKIATAVWAGPEKNFWITAIMSTVGQHLQLPPPPPGAPGMFRCAQPGFMAGVFQQAGLKNITETEISGKLNVSNINGYWIFMNEVAAPVVAALSKIDDVLKEKIKGEVYELVNKKYPHGEIAIDSTALIIQGEK
ncbi:class I SAM-dependent methyltransferase [Hymenobacter sp. BT683]|uniref:Class I SAM-dependent methyltransferase n=1 Tax=Hymenobacter jeongseonensis TaxID=2791027 RepID=A0ABS0IDW8_9BACT|nr:class I SAM-dependent methyltransferase [Hymenobacter jeongseonensis]MBF9236552.1 class I SAM-dependent methyltransferase [Hymenobacter jeongseonensis]